MNCCGKKEFLHFQRNRQQLKRKRTQPLESTSIFQRDGRFLFCFVAFFAWFSFYNYKMAIFKLDTIIGLQFYNQDERIK